MARTKPAQPIRLYRHPLSGHSHRVQLFLSLLSLPYESIDVDLAKGEHKKPEFLAKNPFGQLPVIEDNGVVLYDSNAILVYLALTYDDGQWMPRDALGQARVQQWFSLAAGQINSGPASARLVNVFKSQLDHERAKTIAENLFAVLDRELAQRPFAIGPKPSVADVAAYTYLAHAPEGSVSLEPYPNIRSWLARIEALPGFVPMQQTQAGLRTA